MNTLLRAEEAIMFAVAVYALALMQVSWWYYLLLAVAPDIGMAGYLVSNSTGAFTYNLFHHKGVAAIIFIAGMVSGVWILQVSGIILFGHSAMDRMFGFGLKYADAFNHTHLGTIGKSGTAVQNSRSQFHEEHQS